jgi:hypothetical protein
MYPYICVVISRSGMWCSQVPLGSWGLEINLLVANLSPELIYPAQAGFVAFWRIIRV